MWCPICRRETDDFCEEKCSHYPKEKLWESEETEEDTEV